MNLSKSGLGKLGWLAAMAFASLSSAAYAQNPNCTLIVPDKPLTAKGLATPYQLTATDPAGGPCNEANTGQSAFVQAAILNPATGAISIYSPLVIDMGTKPAAAPVVPKLPAGAVVGIWFGYNGDTLTLQAAYGSSLAKANCVNGLRGSEFTQFAYCNAPNFFAAANNAIQKGKLQVPALGTALDGQPCPTVRNFFIVDQDQSDNVQTQYLATAQGTTAQDTAANRAAFAQATVLGNPSDNALLTTFVDGAFQCQPWTAPNLADPGQNAPGLALNELQARMLQETPVALVPLGDPMTQVNAKNSAQKTNLYRMGVDQPVISAQSNGSTKRYCRQILRIAPERLNLNAAVLTAATSPAPDVANSLFTFLAQRLVGAYQLLNCAALINQALPIATTTNAAGVTVFASIDGNALTTILSNLQTSLAADDIADSMAQSR